MIKYNKQEIRDCLSYDDIFELLEEWGGEPEYCDFGIICSTICHNLPGEGSRKLYFYKNTNLFHCYTHCGDSFDIFELTAKVMKNQYDEDYDLNDAVRWVAARFGIAGVDENDQGKSKLEDWSYFGTCNRIKDVSVKSRERIILKEYDDTILSRFNYDVKIKPWLDEDISQEVLELNRIGFYPGGDQITIPHWDYDGRFVGLRGRTVCKEEGELYGKYRPLRVNGQLYNHSLGMNLYNIQHAKEIIKLMRTAIIFEGEKSVLKYQTMFGYDNDIAVACCGSSISTYQIQLLLEAGAQEIIIALDRQFQEIGDYEFKHLKNNLLKLFRRYHTDVNISFLFDKNKILDYKSSPIDEGYDKFWKLFKDRVRLTEKEFDRMKGD